MSGEPGRHEGPAVARESDPGPSRVPTAPEGPGPVATGRRFLVVGSLGTALGVALGAFGAHALEARASPEMLEVWQTAVLYHLVHAVGLLVVGILALHLPESAPVTWSGRLLALGIVLFSGSLYLLVLTRVAWLGALTPLGGIAFLAGWALLSVGVIRSL